MVSKRWKKVMAKGFILTDKEERILIELKETLRGSLGEQMRGLILYGSRARGNHNEESDIDIAVIVGGLNRDL